MMVWWYSNSEWAHERVFTLISFINYFDCGFFYESSRFPAHRRDNTILSEAATLFKYNLMMHRHIKINICYVWSNIILLSVHVLNMMRSCFSSRKLPVTRLVLWSQKQMVLKSYQASKQYRVLIKWNKKNVVWSVWCTTNHMNNPVTYYLLTENQCCLVYQRWKGNQ